MPDILEKTLTTATQYRLLPEGEPCQLIDGELIYMTAPNIKHQELSVELTLLLGAYIKSHQLGKLYHAPCDVFLSENNVYQPDLLFVAQNRLHIIQPDGIHGAPDLVIEILSQSTYYYDAKKKLRNYEKYGVQEFFLIDPEDNEVISYRLQNGKYAEAYRETGLLDSVVLGAQFRFDP